MALVAPGVVHRHSVAQQQLLHGSGRGAAATAAADWVWRPLVAPPVSDVFVLSQASHAPCRTGTCLQTAGVPRRWRSAGDCLADERGRRPAACRRRVTVPASPTRRHTPSFPRTGPPTHRVHGRQADDEGLVLFIAEVAQLLAHEHPAGAQRLLRHPAAAAAEALAAALTHLAGSHTQETELCECSLAGRARAAGVARPAQGCALPIGDACGSRGPMPSPCEQQERQQRCGARHGSRLAGTGPVTGAFLPSSCVDPRPFVSPTTLCCEEVWPYLLEDENLGRLHCPGVDVCCAPIASPTPSVHLDRRRKLLVGGLPHVGCALCAPRTLRPAACCCWECRGMIEARAAWGNT